MSWGDILIEVIKCLPIYTLLIRTVWATSHSSIPWRNVESPIVVIKSNCWMYTFYSTYLTYHVCGEGNVPACLSFLTALIPNCVHVGPWCWSMWFPVLCYVLAAFFLLSLSLPEKIPSPSCFLNRKPTETCFMHAADIAPDTPSGVAHANLALSC